MTLRNLAALALAALVAVSIAGLFALAVVLPTLMTGAPR